MADVKLHRPGWTNKSWSPHGLFKPVRFNEDDTATLDVDSYDEWIGDDMARSQGITVTREAPLPEVPKCPTCGASGDDPCVKNNGKPAAKTHKNRP